MLKNKLVFITNVILGTTVIGILLGLTGCDNNSKTNNTKATSNAAFDKTQLEEYTQSMFTYEDGIMYVEYVSKDHKDFVLLKCKMSEKESDDFFGIDCDEENYEEQCLTYLSQFDSVTTESLNAKIPETETMTSYADKTIADLEADGFEQTGVGNGDDDYIYFEYSDDKYVYKVAIVQKYKALFDMENVDLKTLKIEEVSFWDFVNLSFE